METSYNEEDYNIRENITPIGDGNFYRSSTIYSFSIMIRENITPIGDGNPIYTSAITSANKLLIRENITPIGDGNIWFEFI